MSIKKALLLVMKRIYRIFWVFPKANNRYVQKKIAFLFLKRWFSPLCSSRQKGGAEKPFRKNTEIPRQEMGLG